LLTDNAVHEIKRAVIAWTEAFTDRSIDDREYASLMTSDYRAVENGNVIDLTAEMRARQQLPSAFERAHRYRFGRIDQQGRTASVELEVDAEITDGRHGVRRRSWAGHVQLRHEGGKWLASGLRSVAMERAV